MKIGELSKRTGVSMRMLRYYEEYGLLSPARTEAGYRSYQDNMVHLVAHIKALSTAGMKLETIKILLPCLSEQGNISRFVGCPEVKAALTKELQSLDEKLADLHQSRNRVAEYIGTLLPSNE